MKVTAAVTSGIRLAGSSILAAPYAKAPRVKATAASRSGLAGLLTRAPMARARPGHEGSRFRGSRMSARVQLYSGR